MIYAECYIIDLKTNRSAAKYVKSFDNHNDFFQWYKMTKKDIDFVVNMMNYNPEEKPGQKCVYDAKLLRVRRDFAT